MNSLKICLDTNIWLDFIERREKKSTKLIKKLTELGSNHTIIISDVLFLEILLKLIDTKKEQYLINNGYPTKELGTIEGKLKKFETNLPPEKMDEINIVLKDIESGKNIKIISEPLDFSKVEILIRGGLELLDSLIIFQSNGENSQCHYFVTRDRVARKINNMKLEWIKVKGITKNGILKLI